MAHCHQGGAFIPADAPQYRRDVYVGGSRGSWWSRRSFGASTRSYHSVRTLCASCAKVHDTVRTIMAVLVIVGVLLLLVVGGDRGCCSSESTSSSSGIKTTHDAAVVTVEVDAANVRSAPIIDASAIAVRGKGARLRVKVPAINKHLNNIFESGELGRAATVSKMETVQSEGGRKVVREIEFYNLDAIIAVGYRVNGYRAPT